MVVKSSANPGIGEHGGDIGERGDIGEPEGVGERDIFDFEVIN